MPGASTMIGRDREFAELLDLVERAAVHVVTVTGLAGVGKTHLARTVLDAVPDSLFVPVAAAGGAQALGDAVLTSLSDHRGLTRSPAQALWESFEGRSTVVVLDDADHATDLVPATADLLADYPPAVLVLTAARPTHVPGEHVIALRPLPVPRVGVAEAHPCIRLFVQQAAEVGVALDTSDAGVRDDVIRVCRQTGGLPLAIELAAARTVTQSLRFIERTLWRRGDDASRRRPRPLYRSLGWALSMLSDAAALTLPQAALFASPFLLDAAAAVIALPDPGDDVYDALTELVDAYLLEFDPDSGPMARFAMREPIRAFALEQVAGGDLDDARRRHARYFRDRCRGGKEVVAREWPDVAQALDYAFRHGTVDDALIIGVGAAPAVQRLAGAETQLRARLDELIANAPDGQVRVDPKLRARAMVWSTALFPTDADDLASVGLWTVQRLAEATALARESGDARALLEALEATVRSLNVTLDLPAAVSAVHEGLALARTIDDQRALARFEAWTAMEAQMRGNVPETVRLAGAALRRGRAHDEPIAVIWAARMLLIVPEAMKPTFDPPVPDLRTLLEMCERSAQPYVGMIVLGDLSRHDAARGNLPGAARWVWRQLMVAADRVHSEPLSTAFGVVNTVSLALRAGEVEEAIRLRESVRALEFLLPAYLPPQLAAGYTQDCARLEQLVPGERYAQLAAQVAGSTMTEANRLAQTWAQRLACRVESEPAVAVAATATDAIVTPLTVREREVLAALASGAPNHEIADDLGVSTKTVMHHSMAIYRKLGVRGRAAASAWAVRAGIT